MESEAATDCLAGDVTPPGNTSLDHSSLKKAYTREEAIEFLSQKIVNDEEDHIRH
jgi:hypothetical protein